MNIPLHFESIDPPVTQSQYELLIVTNIIHIHYFADYSSSKRNW